LARGFDQNNAKMGVNLSERHYIPAS
jgi:hypothetical protein